MSKLSLLAAAVLLCPACSTALNMFIGTEGDNVYEAVWDGKTLKTVSSQAVRGATYFTDEADGLYYSVSGGRNASIVTYRDGKVIAKCPNAGGASCFILKTPHPYIFTAEYSAATVSAFSMEDGVVTKVVQNTHFDGCGPHPNQKTAHMHQIRMLPEDMCKAAGVEGEWYLATDLGTDLIRCFCYHEAPADSVLEYVPALDVTFKPGSGPRHMEFNHKYGLVYCVTELSDDVVTFRLGSSNGEPSFTQLSCIHADEVYAGGGADIHLSPDGRFLYSSHRLKSDGIAIFKVSQEDGTLERIGYQYTESHPRNFVLSPDGKILFVACRDGKCVQIFDINQKTGMLTERTSAKLTIDDGPMCVILK